MWGEAQEKAFNEVKLRLKNPPVYIYPEQRVDSYYIQIQALKELEVPYGRFKKQTQIDRLCQ